MRETKLESKSLEIVAAAVDAALKEGRSETTVPSVALAQVVRMVERAQQMIESALPYR